MSKSNRRFDRTPFIAFALRDVIREVSATWPLRRAFLLPTKSLQETDVLAAVVETLVLVAATFVPKANDGSSVIFGGCHGLIWAFVDSEDPWEVDVVTLVGLPTGFNILTVAFMASIFAAVKLLLDITGIRDFI